QTLGARRAGADGVYSLGRVQTPALALIVARDPEIATFVPVAYFEVVAEFQVAAGSYQGRWGNAQGSRLATQAAADAIAAKVRGGQGTGPRGQRRGAPPPPPGGTRRYRRQGAGSAGPRRAGRDAGASGAPAVAL